MAGSIQSSIGPTWNTIFKTSNESRTSTTTLADDAVLKFTVTTNAVYSFELWIVTYTGAGNMKYALSAPGSLVGRGIRREHGDTTTASAISVSSSPPSSTNLPNSGVHGYIHLCGAIETGASGGTVVFQFAQQSSNGDSCFVVNGSWLKWVRVS